MKRVWNVKNIYMIQLYTFFKVLCVIYKGDKYMNHKILEHKFEVGVI